MIQHVSSAELRKAGRSPITPCALSLADGSEVILHRLLRVLPAKRIVGEGEWAGQRVLVKLFVAKGSLRHWQKEKSGIEALQQSGIPTPALLQATTIQGGGHAVLTRFLEAAQSLADDWAPFSKQPAGRAEALAVLLPAFKLLGEMHSQGLLQEDLHLGNFLRCADELYVIDGDAVHSVQDKPLATQPTVSNLALLMAQLPASWDAFRTPLLEAYQAGGGKRITDPALLERELTRIRKWRQNDFLAKTIRDCTLFAVQQSTLRFVAARRDIESQLSPLLDLPDEAIAHGKLLKDGRTCTVAKIQHADTSLVIKRYNLKSLRHALARLWRPTRAWHSWREGHRLRFLGIATPEPLALLEERFGPLRRRAFLVNEYCPGTNLLSLLSPDQAPAAEVALGIQALFESLFRLRITHGDLKATNLLWHEDQVFVIDLDAMEQHRSITSFSRAWKRERARLLRNWPAMSVLHQWLDEHLPPVR